MRVRKALDYAFDFEWTNKNIFYGLYTRTESFFENSDMKATGKPSPAELALLEPLRGQLPPEVFDEALQVAGLGRLGPGPQACCARPAQLLGEAGWQVKDGKRVNAKGEMLELEFLITDPTTERILTPYVKNLQAIGVRSTHPPHRPGAVRAARQVVRFRRGHHALLAAPDARRRDQELSGAARRPRRTAATISPASATPPSMP